MSAPTLLHFARFEFKYVLAKPLRDEFERELGYFMTLDPFAASAPDHRYTVRSLYFEDAPCSAYYDKIDGLHSRHKFRLRAYTDDPARSPVRFLEVKGRHNNLVYKHRVALEAQDVDRARGGRLAEAILARGGDSAVVEQFRYEFYRKRLAPLVGVDYARRPYVSRYDPGFRLTFDSGLTGAAADALFQPSSGPRAVLPGYTIMEVKFQFRMPAWFHRLIQSYELTRVPFSKVCKAMEVCELAENLE